MRDLAVIAFVLAIVFAVLFVAGRRQWRRKEDALLARRPNPTRQEYLAIMADHADPDVAEWLCDELRVYFKPRLTPHPDDDLVKDLPIDHDEPNDWLLGFCQANGLRLTDLRSWDPALPVTVRNFATWLSDERRRLTSQH